jgi:hypothetical protein
MIPRVVTRRIRPMWIAALASALWVNRNDVVRWYEFLRRAVDQREARPLSEWITEAKVRFAVSTDPVLRRDPTLNDVEVRDGVVTLMTNTGTWPDPREHIRRLRRVKGIADVTTVTSATSTA